MKTSAKRIIAYRLLAFSSEFLIVFVVTGNLITPTITTGACIVVHTALHWFVERIWKDKKSETKP